MTIILTNDNPQSQTIFIKNEYRGFYIKSENGKGVPLLVTLIKLGGGSEAKNIIMDSASKLILTNGFVFAVLSVALNQKLPIELCIEFKH